MVPALVQVAQSKPFRTSSTKRTALAQLFGKLGNPLAVPPLMEWLIVARVPRL